MNIIAAGEHEQQIKGMIAHISPNSFHRENISKSHTAYFFLQSELGRIIEGGREV